MHAKIFLSHFCLLNFLYVCRSRQLYWRIVLLFLLLKGLSNGWKYILSLVFSHKIKKVSCESVFGSSHCFLSPCLFNVKMRTNIDFIMYFKTIYWCFDQGIRLSDSDISRYQLCWDTYSFSFMLCQIFTLAILFIVACW